MSVIPTRDQVPHIVRPATAMPRPAGPQAAGGLTGRDVMGILRRRVWLILVCLLVCVAASIVATVLWGSYAPLYTARGLLGVNPPQGDVWRSAVSVNRDVMDRLLADSALLVKTEQVLQTVARNDEVRQTNWFRKDPDTAVDRLRDDVSAVPSANGTTVGISFTSRDAVESATIANVLLSTYVEDRMQVAKQDVRSEIDDLRKQEAVLEERLRGLQDSKAKEGRTGSIPGLREKEAVMRFQLQSYVTNLTTMRSEKARAEEDLRLFREQVASGEFARMVRPEMQDPILNNLQGQKQNLEIALESARKKYGPVHRRVKDLENSLASVSAQLEAREKRVIEEIIATQATQREGFVAAQSAQLLDMQRQFDAIRNEVSDLQERRSRLENIETQITTVSENLKRVQGRLLELRIQEGGTQAQVFIQARATPPREPSWPKWKVMIPVGVLLGIVVGVGLAFLLELVDTSIKNPSDISRRVDLPLLGMIPHADDLEDEFEDLRLAVLTNPATMIGEAFRQVRTCLLFSGPAEGRKTLLVTSAMPEDGRTTVAVNLAASIAQGGRKVLVVDANFRQPMIRRLFPQCSEGGLSSALVGQATWQKQVVEVSPNLCVMASGPLPPNPADLLGSEEMRKILDEMGQEYDQVIIDGAPALVVTDSSVLSTLIDGVMLVVRAGANTHGIVQRTKGIFDRVGAHIIGVTLNAVRVTAGGYLRKNYETFYEYHEDQPRELPAKA